MDSWHSYPKVFALGHRYLENLFKGPFQVEEKLDGSQFSFGLARPSDGWGYSQILCRSKGAEIDINDPPKMFATAVKWVLDNSVLLRDGWTYRAEWIPKLKSNVLTYGRIPKNGLMLFDISTGLEKYLSWTERLYEAARIGLECVPVFLDVPDEGDDPLKEAEFHALLNRHSCLAAGLDIKVEGVVIKNYRQFGQDGHTVFGKYVSEQFKEQHGKEKYTRGKAPAITSIVNYFKTEARWRKAVQHLEESGRLLSEPKDIGPLILEIKTDFERECQGEAGELLYKEFQRDILKGLTAGVAEWYKAELAKKQFTQEVTSELPS